MGLELLPHPRYPQAIKFSDLGLRRLCRVRKRKRPRSQIMTPLQEELENFDKPTSSSVSVHAVAMAPYKIVVFAGDHCGPEVSGRGATKTTDPFLQTQKLSNGRLPPKPSRY